MTNNLIFQALENIEFGTLRLTEFNGKESVFNGKKNVLEADIKILDKNLFDLIISGGDIVFGETYIKEMWNSSNLQNLLTLITINSNCLEKFFHAKKFQAFLLFLKSFFNKNTIRGSKKNITSHYDLGNEFYEIWLDETMTYSSAFFNNKNISLVEAQKQKYHNIISKLNNGNVLEIGCGWGGFAFEAAKAKFNVTCLTISNKQKDFIELKLKQERFSDLISIKLQDYRNEKSIYDNVVSIEMFEAVGKEYWKKYFQTIRSVLKTNGKALLQIITIDEQVFDDYINRVDFIQKHIFPGGILPSKSSIRSLAMSFGFKIKSELSFADDYSKTLEIWLKNFDDNVTKINSIGFSEEFIRKWRFYLCYCIAGFNSKRTDVVQFELQKL